ncbi:DUF4489 domain-containing protein [Wukongibacter baidiensis]|uniref:DUF4489 domain-containing protein n=1 Tax=Wukongibacter baidiensis TaxID=1723361 RepID=UPI003D7F4917
MSALKKKSDCDNKKDKDNKSLFLFCGQGVSTVFLGTENDTRPPIPPSSRIAEVEADTRGMDRPVIEIEFSSIVNLLSFPGFDDDAASLSFLLFRAQDDNEPVLVNSWPYEVFEMEEVSNIRLSTSFVFNFCECLDTSGCFTYFVEVSGGGIRNGSLGINNVEIAALVGESCC